MNVVYVDGHGNHRGYDSIPQDSNVTDPPGDYEFWSYRVYEPFQSFE